MDQDNVFFNEFSIPNGEDDLLLESEMTGWQPFSTPGRFQMQKQFLNSLLPQRTPKCYNENGPVGFLDEQNRVSRRFTPPSEYQKNERLENRINTDFLSAIPNARQSKTVKRKLTYEDDSHNRVTKAKNTSQKPKTYFPYEFIGHATRQSVSLKDSLLTSKEYERSLNPTMVSGHALRKSDANGSVFHASFTTQSETPLPQRKRTRKFSSKKKSNSQVALEQHFEQIRRKHAEFNWDIPDSQNTIKDEGISSTDMDIQRVPTTPFFEQYTASPSLYSSNETPVQTSMSLMPVPTPRLGVQNIERGRNQRFAENVYSNNEAWSTSIVPTQTFTKNPSGVTNEGHLYPY